MERHFDEQLTALKGRLVRMGALAERMIGEAMKALTEGDLQRAANVSRHEEEVNGLQIEIDEICLQLIATHQPVAADLRYLIGAIKINSELERLADQAVNVCDKAKTIAGPHPDLPWAGIPAMATMARSMVKDSLHAYIARDVDLARRVLRQDDELDAAKARVTAELTAHIGLHPRDVAACIALVLVARNLERIGDHATNISEIAIFVVQGKDIRHHAEERPPA